MEIIKTYIKCLKTNWKSLLIPALVLSPFTYLWGAYVWFNIMNNLTFSNSTLEGFFFYGSIILFIAILIFGPYNLKISEKIKEKYEYQSYILIFIKVQIISLIFSCFLLFIFLLSVVHIP